MKFVQLSAALLTGALVLPGIAWADGHGDAADTVATAIGEYWVARNAGDHKTVANLESAAGIYGTNSDGSFHKPFGASSADDWQRNMAGQKNNMQVFYPEVAEIADGVVYARYYLEGMVGDASDQYPYRTRVTNVWTLEEDGEWRIKAMHFSNAGYGGTHRTQSADFQD
jgi:ketosteroid isomerase-like protein